MNYTCVSACAVVLWIGPGLLTAAGQYHVAVKWTALEPWVADSKVALVMLPSGTHIQGKVRVVQQDGLRMRVTKTSDKKVMRKGEQLIPRQSVSLLRVTNHGIKWRMLCTLGAVAAAGIAVGSQDIGVYEGPAVAIVPAVVAGGMVGLGFGGYYIGKRLDKETIDIRIIPED